MNSSYQPYSYYAKTYGRGWWDKYQHQPSGKHMKGKGEEKGEYKKEKTQGEKRIRKTTREHCSNQELTL